MPQCRLLRGDLDSLFNGVSRQSTKPLQAYVYGMTLLSTIHQLKDGFPKEDSYGEIVHTSIVPGGEAANGATLLSHWGVETQLDGTHLGSLTRESLLESLEKYGVDCSLMHYDPEFEGWKDVALCGGGTRTVFGWFQALFGLEDKHWSEVNVGAVRRADVVALDPFFGDSSLRVAKACIESDTPFVSIDVGYECLLARAAAAIVISGEFREREFPGVEREELLRRYRETCQGLVIFTSGAGSIDYAHEGSVYSLSPYCIEVVDTLAAGDTFRAGVAYGVAKDFAAGEIVRYGAASAALVCGRFPSIHPVPCLAEVEALVEGG